MRLPTLSTGAWVFTGLVTAAIIAPASVYAAASTVVAIGNAGNSTTASVTNSHQLLTTPIDPKAIITGLAEAPAHQCTTVYTPPAGKGFVLTNITYDIGSGTDGTESFGAVADNNCGNALDYFDTTRAYETQARTFQAGLPMPLMQVLNQSPGVVFISYSGYLVPASQLPAAAPAGEHAKATKH